MYEDFGDWPEFGALKADLERFWEDMAAEALALVDGPGFRPWHEPQIYDGRWDVHGLYWAGREIDRRAKAPVAKEVLGSWQSVVFNAGFSLMRPDVWIKPHVGYTADVLRLHLALSAPVSDPQVVGMRVGAETRGWVAGECLLFDDTQEHEAWNRSRLDRVVLLVDVLRPAGRAKRRPE